jgi:UDP-glucose 4-epimerase
MRSPQHAVVTGGAGFIGSELVRQLAERGTKVTVVDNLVNGKRENLDGVLGPSVRLEATDIRDLAKIRELLRSADVIFHLACLGVRHSIHAPHENHDVNATATLALLQESKKCGVRRFVHVSSSEIYGTAKHVPMSEEHPPWPMTVYGAAKLAGECYARAYHRTYGYETVVIRPFNAYGPRSHHEGDSGEVIPKFLLRAMCGRPLVVFGDGEQTRDFMFVGDAARGIIEVGLADSAIGETFNLGTGVETTVNQLAKEVAVVLGASREPVIERMEPRPGDVLRLCADMSKARALTGFTTRISLQDGLRALLEWYRASGSAPEKLLEAEIVQNWQPRQP